MITANLTLHFEANQGQTDGEVRFLSRGSGHTLFLTATEAVMVLRNPGSTDSLEAGSLSKGTTPEPGAETRTASTVVRIRFVGANPSPQITGLDELPGKANYFVGSDPVKWRTNVSMYAKVKYENIYPGIDLVYYGNQRQLEYDFVVAPGADPGAIKFAVEGADEVSLDGQGSLVIHTRGGDVVLKSPETYQEVDGARRKVSGGLVATGERQVGFQVAAYDPARPLIIDPVLAYSTYLGGTQNEGDFYGTWAGAIAVDNAGNVFVTGTTTSADFPTANPFQGTYAGYEDVFVAKINAAGSALIYATYLGGSDRERGKDIAVDASGNAYVTGSTESWGFPTADPFQSFRKGSSDAFVTKLNPAGSALVYSTYLGGSSSDGGTSIAVDGSSNAFVTGWTSSSDFPTVNPIQPTHGGGTAGGDVFVTKFNAAGSALLYCTYLGGSETDVATSIALDSLGSAAYVTGYTNSTNFPTANPIQVANAGGFDAFVAKINGAGSALVYSTYLGGSGEENHSMWKGDIAVDGFDSAYVTGNTGSADFPTVNPIQGTKAGFRDAFVTKINAAGSALVYSTYLGGSSDQAGYGIAIDSSANAYIVGLTYSTDFPTASPIQATNGGLGDGFVTKINAAGSALVYSTYLGGSNIELASSIVADDSGGAYVTGLSASTDFPTLNPIQGSLGGPEGFTDAFVAKIQTPCQTDLDCDDANVCTTDVCDPQDPGANPAGCAYTNNSDPCNDGNACTIDDTCSAGDCAGGPPLDCDDGNVCTDESCNPSTGCEYTNNTDPCDDGDVCTTNDICTDGVCTGNPRPGCLDHFLCYKTKARQDISPTLSDDFDSGTYEGRVAKLFCTPADKNAEGILDQDTHLMGYKIKGPHQWRTNIEVENQFGILSFDTKKTDTLLVPTAKSLAPDPFPGQPDPGSLVDHYRCLKVRITKGTEKFSKLLRKTPVLVTDQFGSRSVYLKKPSKLCLPVDKNLEGIKNPDAHLLCYKIKADPRTSRTGIQTTNQFGQATLELKKEAELCVPSLRNPTATTTTSSTTTTSTSTTTTTVP